MTPKVDVLRSYHQIPVDGSDSQSVDTGIHGRIHDRWLLGVRYCAVQLTFQVCVLMVVS